MAEGLLKNIYGNAYEIYSAGTRPTAVRPEAIKVMSEIGIDISENRSKSVDEFAGRNIDYVLTVCDNAREDCPYFPARTRLIHHAFDDPAAAQGSPETLLSEFRRVRDKIDDFLVNNFAKVIGEA